MSFRDDLSQSSMSDEDEILIKIENKNFTDSDGESEEDREKRTEIQEQVYQDKLACILKQVQQLENGTHVDFVKRLKILDIEQKKQLMMNSLWRDCLLESIEREFIRERRIAHKEFENRSIELTETLIAELNERKKAIELDNLNMELSPESAGQKATITRKLRRRPNDPVIPAPQEKRRKPPPISNICYMLHEHEIEQDVKAVQEALTSIPSTCTTPTPSVKSRDTLNSTPNRKPGVLPNSSTSIDDTTSMKTKNSNTEGLSTIPDTRIVDGKLHFEKKWYHRGQPVFVEGKQIPKFSAVISAIGSETIWVKKTSDNSKFRINLSYLSKGKMSVKRRAAV